MPRNPNSTFKQNVLPPHLLGRLFVDMSPEERAEYHKFRRAGIKAGTWTFRPWTTRTEEERKARRRESMRRANANRYTRGRRLIEAAKDGPCIDCGIRTRIVFHDERPNSFSPRTWSRSMQSGDSCEMACRGRNCS